MGAFGYGGLESDAAFDLTEGILKKIRAALRKRMVCGGSAPATIRAAAELVIRMHDCGVFIDEDTVDLAVDKLETVVDCGFDDWRDPGAAEQATLQQIRRLAAIRNQMRRRRR